MKKIVKEIVLVCVLSIILTGIYISALILLLEEPIVSLYIFSFWILNLLPAYLVTISYLSKKNTAESFEFGFKMGLMFEWFAFFIPLLISPYLSFEYFKFKIKDYKLKKLYNKK